MKTKDKRVPKRKMPAARRAPPPRSKPLRVAPAPRKRAKVETKLPVALALPIIRQVVDTVTELPATPDVPVIWNPLAVLATQQLVATTLAL